MTWYVQMAKMETDFTDKETSAKTWYLIYSDHQPTLGFSLLILENFSQQKNTVKSLTP